MQQELKELEIDGEIILKSDSTKFLVLWIDENFNWKRHTTILINKLKRNVNLLKKTKKNFPSFTLRLIYYAHLHSKPFFPSLSSSCEEACPGAGLAGGDLARKRSPGVTQERVRRAKGKEIQEQVQEIQKPFQKGKEVQEHLLMHLGIV